MLTIRDLLSCLPMESLQRLCSGRELPRGRRNAMEESLARSYRGRFEMLYEELLKTDLAKLLNQPTTLAGEDYYLPSANSYPRDELVRMARKAFERDVIPKEFQRYDALEDDDDVDEGLRAIEEMMARQRRVVDQGGARRDAALRGPEAPAANRAQVQQHSPQADGTRLRTEFSPPQGHVDIGAVLDGHWEVVRRLGRGGFGLVFEIRSRGGMVRVAKFPMPGTGASDAVARSYLNNELRRLQDLQHSHICSVYGMRMDERYGEFLQLEHGGVSLFDKANGQPMPRREALRVVRDTASALDYLHREGVVHGDVSPNNILIDAHGTIRLTDFGISARLETAGPSQYTRVASRIRGLNMTYASPEVQRSLPVTKHSDQYSLAMVYVALVTGSHANPPPLDEALRKLPSSTRAGLLRALHPVPSARYPSCLAFAGAMEA